MGLKKEVFGKQLVLVGGGHTHALLIRMFAQDPIPGVKTILVSDAYHVPYSGTLPGYLSGFYHFDESHIDLYRLCTWAGVEFVHASVEGIDPKEKRIALKDRPSITYDILSIDIGSTPKMDDVPGAISYATGIKPVPQFLSVFNAMIHKIEAGKLTHQSIVIVGGGAGGVEVALGLRQRLAREHDIHIVHKGAEVLNDKPLAVRKKFRTILDAASVKLHLAAPVLCVEKHALMLNDRQLDYNFLFWMTQASPAPWLRSTGLDLDERGFIAVRDTLQTLVYDNIFAAGDIASVVTEPRPKAGVFAVRQAKPLAKNLRLVFAGAKARAFKPQAQFLAIIGTGDEKAVAMRGRFSASGAWAWRWKVRIDRKFMKQFEDLPEVSLVYSADSVEDVRSKWLEQAHLAAKDSALLQCSDFFSSVVDDPFLLGSIAVHHCANEVFARGGVPDSASIDLRMPSSTGRVAENQQSRILAGVRTSLDQIGAAFLSSQFKVDAALGIGLVMTGSVNSSVTWRKGGMNAGDAVILTKPLGTGLILTAAGQLRAKGRWVEEAIQSMLKAGTQASAVALGYRASSCGHVSRSGLAGLLSEMHGEHMQFGKKVSVRLNLLSLPLLRGVEECLRLGIESVQTAKNVEQVRERVSLKSARKALDYFPLLFDPQLAGGMLFTVSQKDSAAALEDLFAHGYTGASVIGSVEDQHEAQIIVE